MQYLIQTQLEIDFLIAIFLRMCALLLRAIHCNKLVVDFIFGRSCLTLVFLYFFLTIYSRSSDPRQEGAGRRAPAAVEH